MRVITRCAGLTAASAPGCANPTHQFRYDVEVTLSVIGGKWRIMLVWFLIDGERRLSAFMQHFPEISREVPIRLRELEVDGIVHREVFRKLPPRVKVRRPGPFGP